MSAGRPRIEGYAIISNEGMIATSDGAFPENLKIPADQEFYQQSMDRASAIANGRFSSEGGPKAPLRRRIVLTRKVRGVVTDPDNANAVLWNPDSAGFEEAWRRLELPGGTLAVSGGTEPFGVFLEVGYDSFFLTRTDASVPHGRPVFPGVGNGVTAEQILEKHGMVLRETRMLDAATHTRVEEWVRRA